MKVEHKKWANLVIAGNHPVDAYLMIYPAASRKTASNQVIKFRKDAHLTDYIKSQNGKIQAAVTERFAEGLVAAETTMLLTAAKKREVLAKIVSGEIETDRLVLVNGKWKKIKCKPDFHEIMKAIELDNKMTGENVQAKANQQAKAEEVKKIVIVEDKR